uniref:Putative ovule protein n=1 Tax=Solanum chacoense TaxID=4108 RepID=A0A0V0GRI3_SOLCH
MLQSQVHPRLDSWSTLQLGLGVKGVLEWVKVPHWLGNGLVVSLYGLGQSSPCELTFGVELGPVPYLYNPEPKSQVN